MGLDICLCYHHMGAQFVNDKIKEVDNANDELVSIFTGKYGPQKSWNKETWKIFYEEQSKIDAAHGIYRYAPLGLQKIEFSSPKYQLFKIGYFRSNYNCGGVNNILRDTIGMCLYEVFGVNSIDKSYIEVQWDESLVRAREMIQKLKNFCEGEKPENIIARNGHEIDLEECRFWLGELEAVVETCEWVLMHKDPECFLLLWSG